jgi:hypothetical protein
MTSALAMDAGHDRTDLPNILRSGIALGLVQSALIALFGFLQPRIAGTLELVVCGLILILGLAVTITLPGLWTRARTLEGIAGAGGIGFTAAIVFLIIDVAVFQPFGLYTNRWLAIGGGSNWWYHPVWWMVGTYLTTMGAWVLANQTAKNGQPNPLILVLGAFVLSAIVLAIGSLIGFPGAHWSLGAFAVAILPALAVYVVFSGIGAKRS